MTWLLGIIAGAAVGTVITALLPDFSEPIAYGIGIFVGRVTSRREFLDLIGKARTR